jgi:hypothetical protein
MHRQRVGASCFMVSMGSQRSQLGYSFIRYLKALFICLDSPLMPFDGHFSGLRRTVREGSQRRCDALLNSETGPYS